MDDRKVKSSDIVQGLIAQMRQDRDWARAAVKARRESIERELKEIANLEARADAINETLEHFADWRDRQAETEAAE